MDPKENKVLKVHKDSLDPRVNPDLKESVENLEHQANQENR